MTSTGRPMRVCLFTPTFLPKIGGAEINADRIVRGLIERGHEVAVLTQRSRKLGPADVPYPVHYYSRPPKQHLWPEILGWPVSRLHRRFPFEVMLAFFGYPNGYAAARPRDRLGFKLVVCGRGADLYPDFHALRKPRVPRTVVEGYGRADRVVMVSEHLRDRLIAVTEALTGSTRIPPLEVVHNGIDLDGLRRDVEAARRGAAPAFAAEMGVVPGRFILHMARLTDVKEHRLVIDAIAGARTRWDAGGWRYVIAGKGSEEGPLRRRVAEHGLEDTVRFVGPRFGTDKFWLLAAARAVVSPSREEGFAATLLEAMAVGLPLVVSDIGPHREAMHVPEAGRLFRTGDAADLADQLFDLLDEPREIAGRAGLRAAERYSLSQMIDAYERICRELASCCTLA